MGHRLLLGRKKAMVGHSGSCVPEKEEAMAQKGRFIPKAEHEVSEVAEYLKVEVHYRLPYDLVVAVQEAAYQRRLTKTAVVEAALRAYLNV